MAILVCEKCHSQLNVETGHHYHYTDCVKEEIDWAIGQFKEIRAYTQDGKTAAACAEAENRLKCYLSNNA